MKMLQQITSMDTALCSEFCVNIMNSMQKTKHSSQKLVSVVKQDFFCVGRPVMGSKNTHAIVIKHIMDSPKIMFFLEGRGQLMEFQHVTVSHCDVLELWKVHLITLLLLLLLLLLCSLNSLITT